MPRLRQSGVADSGRVLQFEGVARHPVTSIAQILSVTGGREINLLIGNAPTPPVLDFTAQILGLDGQIAQSGSDTNLSANLFANGGLVEAYVAANWNWTIDSDGSGGASFSGDDLTVGPNVGQVVIRATYDNTADPGNPANGTTITATTNVVALPLAFTVELTRLPASAVQGNIYTLGAERRDGVTQEVLDDNPANFTFVITVGGAFGSIINGNQLQVNAGTAGNSITVQVTHNAGGESDTGTTNIIVQPTFSDNEPEGLTPFLTMDGSSKAPGAGWTVSDQWNDDNRVSVVVDGASKFGNAIEKRFFVDDPSDWNGLFLRNIGLFSELYFRFVFLLSDNWDFNSGGNSKLVYYNRHPSGGGFENILWGESPAWSDSVSTGSGATKEGGRYAPKDYVDASGESNPSNAKFAKNVYHTVEIHHVASITPGSGSLRYWLNGVEHTQFYILGEGQSNVYTTVNKTWRSTINDSDKRIGRGVEVGMFWGGAGDNKKVNDFIRFSEIYISTKD